MATKSESIDQFWHFIVHPIELITIKYEKHNQNYKLSRIRWLLLLNWKFSSFIDLLDHMSEHLSVYGGLVITTCWSHIANDVERNPWKKQNFHTIIAVYNINNNNSLQFTISSNIETSRFTLVSVEYRISSIEMCWLLPSIFHIRFEIAFVDESYHFEPCQYIHVYNNL